MHPLKFVFCCRAALQDSFERAKSWVKELQRQGNPNIVIALAGNKTDLSIKRKVDSSVRHRFG
eukprot:COSAG01_NODE_1759_length_9301_cov_24.140622_2_plen_63_part_00